MSHLVPALPPSRLDLAVAIAGPADLPYELVFEPAEVAQPAGQRSYPLAKVRTWKGLKGAT